MYRVPCSRFSGLLSAERAFALTLALIFVLRFRSDIYRFLFMWLSFSTKRVQKSVHLL